MNRSTVNKALLFAVLCQLSFVLYAQETAPKYFEEISEYYKSISDYTADLRISRGDTVQQAFVQYKQPNLLRLDFSEPEGMVMLVDSTKLQVWVPEYQVSFEQKLKRDLSDQLPDLATSRGLELMQRYYTIAYAEKPEPIPLEEGSSEMVIKFRLVWKSNNEGFRELEISVNPDFQTIRRINGLTTGGEQIYFDFTNIVVNAGIPDARFDYESPPTGNTIENFLFE